jgi:hypothetical protein
MSELTYYAALFGIACSTAVEMNFAETFRNASQRALAPRKITSLSKRPLCRGNSFACSATE